MKRTCVAARIGDDEALDAGNIGNIAKSSNDVSADSGRNPEQRLNQPLMIYRAGTSFGPWHCRKSLA
jgi:hypothetical protein